MGCCGTGAGRGRLVLRDRGNVHCVLFVDVITILYSVQFVLLTTLVIWLGWGLVLIGLEGVSITTSNDLNDL